MSYVHPADTPEALRKELEAAFERGDEKVKDEDILCWRTVFKARRLGLLDEDLHLTEKGRDYLRIWCEDCKGFGCVCPDPDEDRS